MIPPDWPRCIACETPAEYVLDDGRQAVCANDECHIVFWDSTMTLEENVAKMHFIDLSGWPE